MANDKQPFRFLEPVFINERMVLNCAAYLYSGVTTEITEIRTNDSKRQVAIRAGLPFLSDVIGFSGEAGSGSATQQHSARSFTVGGLHMNVIDALRENDYLREITRVNDATLDEAGILDKFVHLHVPLRSSPYFAFLRTLQTLGPLVGDLLQDYGDELFDRVESGRSAWNKIAVDLPKYSESIRSTVDRLLQDYLTSGQLEMLMYSNDFKPIGVVDLDIGTHSAERLMAALTGGRYHVFGKVVAKAKKDQKLSMLQRTTLFEVAELLNRIVAAQENRAQMDDLLDAVNKVNQVVSLELPGPCLRVSAMSVCL